MGARPEVAFSARESALDYAREVRVALEELDLPVIAINPAEPPTDLESMQRYGVQVVFMSGVGHFLMMENPERFYPLLREVIAKLLQ
jgi:pimeloyl-ACP methyl ester carboxylesterase